MVKPIGGLAINAGDRAVIVDFIKFGLGQLNCGVGSSSLKRETPASLKKKTLDRLEGLKETTRDPKRDPKCFTLRSERLTNDERTILVKSRWIAADLYDRWGCYGESCDCLEEVEEVDILLKRNTFPHGDVEQLALLESLLMFRVLCSVAKHREGNLDAARELSHSLQEKVTSIISDTHKRYKPNRPPPELLVPLYRVGWRIAYAYGRHLLSRGRVEEVRRALDQFGYALDFCSKSMQLSYSNNEEAQHIRFWNGMALTGLARAALELGKLKRAQRLSYVARTLLKETQDDTGVAFIDSLLGGIYRQQGRREEAIEHLQGSIKIFLEYGHRRYFHRALYELVKVQLNRSNYDEAERALSLKEQFDKLHTEEDGTFTGDPKTKDRWEASASLLQARIALGRGEYEKASKGADHCLAKIGDHSEDLQAQAHAVLAEIMLSRNMYGGAVDHCLQGLALELPDPTDRAWLTLVLCETYLRRKDINSASVEFDRWSAMKDRVENEIQHQRASRLKTELNAERDCFYIPASVEDLKYADLNLQLRRFLVRRVRATRRGSTQEEQATELGITRQTYSSWITELRGKDLIDD